MRDDLVDTVFVAINEMNEPTTLNEKLNHLVQEVGELATEVAIESGHSIKKQGTDKVVGEAIDVMLCCLDLIHKADSSVDSQAIIEIAQRKLEKWKSNVKKKRGM